MLIQFILCVGLLFGVLGLAVDFGHILLTKTEAQTAADAAALYAAGGLVSGTPATVRARAVTAALENTANGSAVVVDPNADVTLGLWDPVTRTFVALTGADESSAIAVKVVVRMSLARHTQVKLMFGSAVGFAGKDVEVTAIATLSHCVAATIPANASPWLAGMPGGSIVPATNSNPRPATAPTDSPVYFAAAAGAPFRFVSISGSTTWDNWNNTGRNDANADGMASAIVGQAKCNGINTTSAPLNAMMGVFLDNSAPNTTAAATQLDFSTAANRNFSTLSPGLKQVFFIGDGLDDSGNLQTFNAPAGATRLYVGMMDQWGWWWDNLGSIQFISLQRNSPVLVK